MLTRQLGHVGLEGQGHSLGVQRRPSLGRVSRPHKVSFWEQPLLMSGIVAAMYGLSVAGAGGVARLLFIFLAVLSCGYYVQKQRPWEYVTLTYWFWTVTPFVRRIIDFHSGFDLTNVILGTPNLIAIFMLKDVLTSRDLLRLRESVIGLFLLIPMFYGLGVSFVQGDIIPGLSSAADWFAPLLYYFYFLANWRRIDAAELPFRYFLTANAIVMSGYAVYQFFVVPAWDLAWALNSGMDVGKPIALQMRIFGMLNSPGPLGFWLSTLLLLFLHFRTKITVYILPVTVLALLVTLVRAAVGSTVIGLVLAGLMGRAGIFKIFGACLLVGVFVVAVLSVTNPEVGDKLFSRYDSVENLGNDGSARARAEIYAKAPELLTAHPFGVGIGGTGRGAVARGTVPVVFDAGPLEIFVALGWVAGAIYAAGFVLVTLQAVLAARTSKSPAAQALAVATVGSAAIIIFTNPAALLAATLWMCAAYAAALGIAAREAPRLQPAVRFSVKE
jgi:hypothetical protein